MTEWSEKWLLMFHPQKCKSMNIAKTKKETEYNYYLEGKNIEWTQEEKDIGVTIDNGLKFDKHISEKVNKANSMFAIIRRALISNT
jgi:hypothetical protein